MGYIIYNRRTTMIEPDSMRSFYKDGGIGYKTTGAARAAMSRKKLNPSKYEVAESNYFFEHIEIKRVKTIQGYYPLEVGVNVYDKIKYQLDRMG